MTLLRRFPRIRAALALAALAAALYAAFLRPLPAHLASGIPYGSYAGAAPPRPLVQGDHLQLLYHFDLFDAYLHGRLPWFRNLWEFNTSDAARPARPDPCYAPFALPYSLARSAGASDALAWNLSQFLSVLLGLAFCAALARRFGAGPGAALALAALASCVPFRWVVLAGGSPTGFGMGLVPAVALGADVAVRDRRLRGGVLAAAALLACYAADLHCFLFAALSLPLWGLLGLLRSPDRPFATRRRVLRLARALAPVALAGALCALLGRAAGRAYESTDVAGGRTLREIELHSPDWHAFFDPAYFSHAPEQFHQGWAIAALLALAGAALVAGAAVAAARLLRRPGAPFRSPSIVFHPAFSSRPASPAPRDTAPLRAALAGILAGAAILFVFLLALGTHGPLDALPLRAVRKLVPPFRMVRQPLKAFCLLPTLYAAFFAVAWSCRPRLRFSKGILAPAVAVVLLAFLSGHRGMRAGLCLEPGADPAWLAVAEDAKARGVAPRALVLPIWPGDSSWSSVYQYHAVRAGVPMLNGYAAVRTHDYADRVFHRFETMTEGDFTDDQAAGLRELGVTHVILHENAFPPKVSLFPFGETLRRHLADPRLRLVASGGGVWAFAVEPANLRTCEPANGPPPAATARRWRLDPPGTNAAVKLRSFAEIHREGYGWLVRAEADKDLLLVTSVPGSGDPATTNRFPAVDGAAPGSWRLAFAPAPFPGTNLWTRLETPGEARISDVAFSPVPDVLPRASAGEAEPVPISVCGLSREFGTTTVARIPNDPAERIEIVPDDLLFVPSRDPPCVAAEGPGLPLPLRPGRYRALLLEEKDDIVAAETGAPVPAGPSPFRFDGDAGLGARPVPGNPAALEFDYDGTSFADFRILYDGTRPGMLSIILVGPAADDPPRD